MGVFSDIYGWMTGQKGLSGPSSQVRADFFPRYSPSRRGDGAILASYHSVPTFRAAANLVANRIADTEWALKEGKQTVQTHPLVDILKNPSLEFSGFEFRKVQQLYRDLLGESFAPVVQSGDSFELMLFPPTSIKRDFQKDRQGWEIKHNNLRAFIARENMQWIKDPDLKDPYGRGKGLGRALADEIEIAEYAARHEKMEFANNARPDFMVFLPGATEDKVQGFKERWKQTLRGPDRSGEGMFIGGPPDVQAEFEAVSRSLEDMTVQELRNFSDKVILQTWGISPEIMGRIEDANRSTSEHAQEIFAENVLEPRLKQIKHGWESSLFPLFEDTGRFHIEYSDPRPEKKAFKLDVMRHRPGAFTDNEWRQVAGFDSREELERVRIDPKLEEEEVESDEGSSAAEDREHRREKAEDKDTQDVIYLFDLEDDQTEEAL